MKVKVGKSLRIRIELQIFGGLKDNFIILKDFRSNFTIWVRNFLWGNLG